MHSTEGVHGRVTQDQQNNEEKLSRLPKNLEPTKATETC
jgi:hypothetical protein